MAKNGISKSSPQKSRRTNRRRPRNRGASLPIFTPTECAKYFAVAEYDATQANSALQVNNILADAISRHRVSLLNDEAKLARINRLGQQDKSRPARKARITSY
jgi:hypothetical protein